MASILSLPPHMRGAADPGATTAEADLTRTMETPMGQANTLRKPRRSVHQQIIDPQRARPEPRPRKLTRIDCGLIALAEEVRAHRLSARGNGGGRS